MSSLSARERRILKQIEGDLATVEPRLEQAQVTARLPAFRFHPVVGSRHARRGQCLWLSVLLAILLGGYGMLTVGLVRGNGPLIAVGIPLAQFSPLVAGYLYRRHSRPVRQKGTSSE